MLHTFDIPPPSILNTTSHHQFKAGRMEHPTDLSTAAANATTPTKITGFSYGLGVSVGILLLITAISLASYFCTRPAPPGPRGQPGEAEDVEAGLDEATLMAYPKVLYSEAKAKDKGTTELCCSICLADYNDTDLLRLLPDCGHLFHQKCVDSWLRLHPTCPLCRTSPLPTPLPTPLAEVVPIRGAGMNLQVVLG